MENTIKFLIIIIYIVQIGCKPKNSELHKNILIEVQPSKNHDSEAKSDSEYKTNDQLKNENPGKNYSHEDKLENVDTTQKKLNIVKSPSNNIITTTIVKNKKKPQENNRSIKKNSNLVQIYNGSVATGLIIGGVVGTCILPVIGTVIGAFCGGIAGTMIATVASIFMK